MVYLEYFLIVLKQAIADFLHLYRVTLYSLVNLAECNVLVECFLTSLRSVLNEVPEHRAILHEYSLIVICISCDMNRVQVFNPTFYYDPVQEDVSIFESANFVLWRQEDRATVFDKVKVMGTGRHDVCIEHDSVVEHKDMLRDGFFVEYRVLFQVQRP